MFQKLGRLEDSVASYNKAIELKPDYAEAHNNLSNSLRKQGKVDEAVACCHKALAIKPDFAGAYHNLGVALHNLGKLKEAEASYRKALAIEPGYAAMHRYLALTKKFSEYDKDIKAMEEAYASPDLSDEERMHIALGLGKSFEDLLQYEKAFGFFSTGNAIKRKIHDYSLETVENTFAGLKEYFTKNLFANFQGSGSSDETPIFILGMPRSGTTLVEQILASHPKVHGAGELDFLDRVVASDFIGIEDANFTEILRQATNDRFSNTGGQYIGMVRTCSDTADLITDKMPDNFRLIGMIKPPFPK